MILASHLGILRRRPGGATLRYLGLAVLLLLAAGASADLTRDQARERLGQYLTVFGRTADAGGTLRYDAEGRETLWRLEQPGDLWARVRGDGRFASFRDEKADDERRRRSERPAESTIRTADQAETLARTLLARLGARPERFDGVEVRFSTAEEDRVPDLQDQVSVRLEERVPPYLGEINSAMVKFDRVTGRVLSAAVADGFTYVPPRRLMPVAEAVARVRELVPPIAQEWKRVVALPDDQAIAADLGLRITGGSLSDPGYAGELYRSNTKRLAYWYDDHKWLTVIFDAETGQLIKTLIAQSSGPGGPARNLGPAPPPPVKSTADETHEAGGLPFGLGVAILLVVGTTLWLLKRRLT